MNILQVEAVSGGKWSVDPKLLPGISLQPAVVEAPLGAASIHANSVAAYLVGAKSGIPKGTVEKLFVTNDSCYEAFYLNFQQRQSPRPPQWWLENHSWGGTMGSLPSAQKEIIARADWNAAEHDLLIVAALEDASNKSYPLLANISNGLTVGILSGKHHYTNLDPTDGRVRPDLVGDSSATSYACPMVSAAAIRLQSAYGLAYGAVARTIRAVLLATADPTRCKDWANKCGKSPKYGAGLLDLSAALAGMGTARCGRLPLTLRIAASTGQFIQIGVAYDRQVRFTPQWTPLPAPPIPDLTFTLAGRTVAQTADTNSVFRFFVGDPGEYQVTIGGGSPDRDFAAAVWAR